MAWGDRSDVARHRRRAVVAGIVVAAILLPAGPLASGRAAAATLTVPSRPNIVLILTDDQRFDTLWAMPAVRERLQAHGITFRNAIVSEPLCCPSRASLLTGLYAGHTGVWGNFSPFGWPAFHQAGNEDHTIATALDAVGYRTALFGKYLNGYRNADGWVPPGWDRWFAFDEPNTAYYDYDVIDAHGDVVRRRHYGSAPSDYSTDVIREQAVRFIHGVPAGEPFFLYLSVAAPHGSGSGDGPATPAPRDVGTFDGRRWTHPPSFNEADVRDKPTYIRRVPLLDAAATSFVEEQMQRRAESLLAVDLLVSRVMDALRDTGALHDTMVVFMSDNGYLQGEHRWDYKSVPHEESIRVPFIVRYDPMVGARAGTTTHELVSNIDLAPTWAALAGTAVDRPIDGVSFLGALDGSGTSRRRLLIEALAYPSKDRPTMPAYCGVRTRTRVFVRYATGEEELYDLATDPFQLRNLVHARPTIAAALRRQTRTLCDPTPPGFSWTP